MSRRLVSSLSDIRAEERGYLRVVCICRRETTFDVADVLAYFRARGWSDAWPDLARRFRCLPPWGCGRHARAVEFRFGEPPFPNDRMPPLRMRRC